MTPAHHPTSTRNGPQEGTQTAMSSPQSTAPDPATQPTDHDGAALLDRVQAALNRYVILPSGHSVSAVVLWIAATHAQPAWAHAPRLVIRAPEKRCGKSRLLDVVEALCWNAFITVNSSPAAVYRSITADPPTLLVDEADTMFGPKADGNEDLRGLLNAGHQRNRPAKRYDAATSRVESIPTFAMAALAGIGVMPDTIEDRAVIVRMRRRALDETVAPYRHKRDRPALRALAAELHTWLRANYAVLERAEPAMPVEDRAADTWEPLFAVAELAGGDWPDRAHVAVLALQAETEDDTRDSDRARILVDIHTAFGDAPALSSKTLAERLRFDPEGPWADHGPMGLTQRHLARLVGEYGIKSVNVRLPDGQQAKGYHRTQFLDTWHRYAPHLPGLTDPAPDDGTGTAEVIDLDRATTGRGGNRPSRPNRPTAGQSAAGWDGQNRGTDRSVPPTTSVPPENALTSTGTAGTAGTDNPSPRAIGERR